MSIWGVGTSEAKILGGGSGNVSWHVSGLLVSVSIWDCYPFYPIGHLCLGLKLRENLLEGLRLVQIFL